MTSDEAKQAFFNGDPVESQGTTYRCISALIYRRKDGKTVLSLELQDKNRNSVTIADCERVHPAAI